MLLFVNSWYTNDVIKYGGCIIMKKVQCVLPVKMCSAVSGGVGTSPFDPSVARSAPILDKPIPKKGG